VGQLLLLLLLLGLAVAAGLTARRAAIRWLLLGGVALTVLAWVPLFLVGALDPDGNPVGLGLLALGGSSAGIGGVALGLVGWSVAFLLDAWAWAAERSGSPGDLKGP
jgi:hypothetical protein